MCSDLQHWIGSKGIGSLKGSRKNTTAAISYISNATTIFVAGLAAKKN